jgi:hypothetical protein
MFVRQSLFILYTLGGVWGPQLFLVAFAQLRKATTSFAMSVRLSVHMEQHGFNWADFHEIWYLNIFLIISRKFQYD